jgi:hypothetical protein
MRCLNRHQIREWRIWPMAFGTLPKNFRGENLILGFHAGFPTPRSARAAEHLSSTGTSK